MNLAGYPIYEDLPSGDKDTRLEPFAAQAEAGNVRLVRGSWNAAYIEELCSIPNGKYRDQADGTSGAFNKLVIRKPWGRSWGPSQYRTEEEIVMSILSEITNRLPLPTRLIPDTRMAEIVGRVSFTAVSPWRHRTTLSVDTTQPDYSFWDLFRRGMAEGYKLAGQFAQPIAEIIASWVLGKGVQAQLADTKDLDPANEADPRVYTNSLLARL
jgi:hypothetical protein